MVEMCYLRERANLFDGNPISSRGHRFKVICPSDDSLYHCLHLAHLPHDCWMVFALHPMEYVDLRVSTRVLMTSEREPHSGFDGFEGLCSLVGIQQFRMTSDNRSCEAHRNNNSGQYWRLEDNI
jgi:hypothetical protein